MKNIVGNTLFMVFLVGLSACSTTKSKSDMKGMKALYHNTTSKFNGYFNAEELIDETMLELDELTQDNYNKVLPVYDYLELDNPTAIAPNMDKAIEKVITVATIHEFSNYVDDCYVLMGKAQYLKQDFAAAEETFQFFEEEFDPKNPYGREYRKAKLQKKTAKDRKNEAKEKRKIADKERKEAEEERKKDRELAKKEQEAKRKERERNAKKRKKGKRGKRTRTSREKKEEEDKETKIVKEPSEEEKAAELQKKNAEELEKQKEALEKKKKEQEEKKKKEQRPQGEGAVFKNKTAFYEGLYWLARTYIETERFSNAKYVFDRLSSVDPLHKDVSSKIPAAKAHLYMREGEIDKAIVHLQEAVEMESDKKLKARYAFIQAQLHEGKGSNALAYEQYKQAKKFSPDYELKFNAELNELKLSYRSGQISQEKVLGKLDKMEKDVKNDPFVDQIYFTKAQVKLDGQDVDGAISDFGFAISSTGGNQNVKLEAYYKLAELLYSKELYAQAKQNYDQALKIMPITDTRYKKVERLSFNLTDIAKNMQTLELQDSLLRLSLMPKEALEDLAREELEYKKSLAKDAAKQDVPKKGNIFAAGNNRQQGAGKSNFFAYNPIALNQGKIDFKRTWGNDRVLENNWRRSLRPDATSGSDLNDEEEKDEDEIEITQEEINEFLREIPMSVKQKEASQGKIANALFELGILFRERLRNYDKSIASLERLIREYPDFEKRDEAMFYLYLSYQDKNMLEEMRMMQKKLATEFPNSKYAKLANDPSYAKQMASEETDIKTYYERTYTLFENRKFDVVLERIKEKGQLFKDESEFDAKLDLLGAMAHGSISGKDRYVKELEQVIRKHKNTPEEVRAKEILRFLKGDAEAFDEILYDEEEDAFQLEDDKLHYIFIVVYNLDQMELQNIKIAISDYNKEYHRRDNLKISNITLNPANKSHVILVRSFDNKEKAMKYYNGADKNKNKFINKNAGPDPSKLIGYDMFAATQRNYREVVKQRTAGKYRKFFEANYIK